MTAPEVEPEPDPIASPELHRSLRAWINDPVAIYHQAVAGGRTVLAVLVQIWVFFREVIRELDQVQGLSRAEALAFATLTSLVPLSVAVSGLIRSYFSRLLPDVQSKMDLLLNLVLPYESPQIRIHFDRFIENAQAASAFGMVVFLFVSFRLFAAVEGAINDIWKIHAGRGLKQKLRAFTMLFFWGPVLIGLSFTTTATLERNPLLRRFIGDTFIVLIPLAVLFIAFTMLFWLVPATNVRLLSALFGAAVTSGLFQLVRWGFASYADQLFAGQLNLIYGSLGLAFVFLVSLQVMWIVILLGVEVSYVAQHLPSTFRAIEPMTREDEGLDAWYALRAAIEIVRRFSARENPPSVTKLSESLGAPDAQIFRVLERLVHAGIIRSLGEDGMGYVPAGDPEQIHLREIIDTVQGSRWNIPKQGHTDSSTQAIDALFDDLRSSAHDALGERTLGELAKNQPSSHGG